MKIIFVNGPPGSGKDEFGKALARIEGVRIEKFATALKLATHGLYAGYRRESSILTSAYFESCKDRPHKFFFGLTPRQAYIGVSETYTKTAHGQAFFGTLLDLHILDQTISLNARGQAPRAWVITDSGFTDEAIPLVQSRGVEACVLVRMFRKGCDFSIDSRGYIELPGVKTCNLHNDGSLEDLDADAHLLATRIGLL